MDVPLWRGKPLSPSGEPVRLWREGVRKLVGRQGEEKQTQRQKAKTQSKK